MIIICVGCEECQWVCVCVCVCVVNLQEQQKSSTVRDGAPFKRESMSGVAEHSTEYPNQVDQPDEHHQ